MYFLPSLSVFSTEMSCMKMNHIDTKISHWYFSYWTFFNLHMIYKKYLSNKISPVLTYNNIYILKSITILEESLHVLQFLSSSCMTVPWFQSVIMIFIYVLSFLNDLLKFCPLFLKISDKLLKQHCHGILQYNLTDKSFSSIS